MAKAISRVTLIVAFLGCVDAVAQARLTNLDIEAQPLDRALSEWAAQTGYQILMPVDGTARVASSSVKGAYTPEGALKLLLAKTDLQYNVVATRTVAIGPEQRSPRSVVAPAAQQSPATEGGGQRSPAPTQERSGIEEVIVSANKRDERLQEVPVPVTAVDAASLSSSNQLRLQDYYSMIPGFSLQTGNTGAALLAIRGITTGAFASPSVGVTVDDVPYGSSTGLGGGGLGVPDIDPSDLLRVEVLRGPQGTLYGASSLGGLLKYVTIDPSTDELSGRLQVGGNHVQAGDDASYNLRGAVNVPMGDMFAVRASAFTRRDAGYITNIRDGREGVNETRAKGGRVSGLWQPTDSVSLKVSALFQENENDGGAFINIGTNLGDLEQDTVPNSGQQKQTVQSYMAALNAGIGGMTFTSLSGYSIAGFKQRFDYSNTRGATTLAVFGTRNTILEDDTETKKFSQEFRLAGEAAKLDWLVGAFYTDEKSGAPQHIDGVDAVGNFVGRGQDTKLDSKFQEYAGFVNLTYHFTDKFDVLVGARQSQIDQEQSQIWMGPFVPVLFNVPAPLLPPDVQTDDSAFTYLLTPRYRFSESLMVYARLASGYRAGGPNSNSTVNALPTFEPDETRNYELGLKGAFFQNMLTIDTSVYYITWNDLQIQLIDPVTRAAVYSNASKARSEGVELAMELRPLDRMRIAASATYNSAELTEDFPPSATFAYGADGDRLPMSSKTSANLSLEQRFPLGRGNAYLGGAVSYVGDRLGPFRAVGAPRQYLPSYSKLDLRAGVEINAWSVDIYSNNVTNKRGLLRGGNGFSFPYAFYYIQPRTIGLNMTRRW
jgi:iron complex outermembrane recepter protein